ncbi:MAG: hypothetical protein Q4C47_03600, partial [Planctomycetia bacterium]|nr:hypothetical protein [Planctomycetia bacterium]
MKPRGTGMRNRLLFVGILWMMGALILPGDNAAAQDDPFAPEATDFTTWVPAEMVTDSLRPTDAEIHAVRRWTHAAFTGTEPSGRPDEFRIFVRRQDHGTFGVGRSCIGTSPLKIGSQVFENGFGTHANSEI